MTPSALWLLAWVGPAAFAPTPMDVDDAVTHALAHSPVVEQGRAQGALGAAAQTGAAAFPTNPVISAQALPRYNYIGRPAGGVTLGVSQAWPLFGRWGHSRSLAAAQADAAESRQRDNEGQVIAAVRRAYVVAQLEQDRGRLLTQTVEAVRHLLELTRQQRDAGAVADTDVNAWRVELARITGQARQQQARYQAACADLGRVVGMSSPVAPTAGLSLPPPPPTTDPSVDGRPDLLALGQEVAAARRDVELQSSLAWPDVTVGTSVTTQDVGWPLGGSGYAAGLLTLSVPFPLFARNQGGRARADANLTLAEAAERRGRLDAWFEVQRAQQDWAAHRAAAMTLQTDAIDVAEANVKLQQHAWEAGQIDATPLVLAQRTVLDVRGEHLNAVAAARLAAIDFALAQGAFAGGGAGGL